MNKIFKSTIIYFLGNILSKVIVFFMLPLYTKYIPAGDMGYYESAIAIVTFFSSVLFLDIGLGIMRFMFEQKELDNKKIPIYSGMVIFLCSLILYIIIATIGNFVFNFEYFIWIALYGFLLCLNTLYGYIARGYGEDKLYALAGIISTIFNVGCNLFFILVFKWDYKALYVSYCMSMLVNIIILEFKCKIIINFKTNYFDKKLLKEMFKFALPLCINSVAFWFLSSANKVIVTSVLGTEANGYLAIANKFTSILYLVSSCFQLAWQELAFSKENKLEESTGKFYSKAYDLYFRILMVGLLLMIPLIKIGLAIFPNFIDASYSDSIILIPLALFGTIMSIANIFLGSIFGGLKKNNIVFISTLAGAIVNIVVIYALINYLGVMAANIAFLAGFTSAVFVRIIVLKKEICLKVNYWYFIILIPIFIGVVYVYDNLNWIYNLIIFIVVIGIGIFVLKNELKEIIIKIKNRRKNGKNRINNIL